MQGSQVSDIDELWPAQDQDRNCNGQPRFKLGLVQIKGIIVRENSRGFRLYLAAVSVARLERTERRRFMAGPVAVQRGQLLEGSSSFVAARFLSRWYADHAGTDFRLRFSVIFHHPDHLLKAVVTRDTISSGRGVLVNNNRRRADADRHVEYLRNAELIRESEREREKGGGSDYDNQNIHPMSGSTADVKIMCKDGEAEHSLEESEDEIRHGVKVGAMITRQQSNPFHKCEDERLATWKPKEKRGYMYELGGRRGVFIEPRTAGNVAACHATIVGTYKILHKIIVDYSVNLFWKVDVEAGWT